ITNLILCSIFLYYFLLLLLSLIFVFFFFNDTPTSEIYTLSLHDALPICAGVPSAHRRRGLAGSPTGGGPAPSAPPRPGAAAERRSEEHTSELQSRSDLVCRLLLEKKKKNKQINKYDTIIDNEFALDHRVE